MSKNKSSQKQITSYQASFSGPLPPPSVLRGYNNIEPGTADRIIKMAEKQLNHRIKLEAQIVESNIKNEKVGMFLAFFLTVFLMSFGAYMIMNDKEVAGYLAIFAPMIFHTGNYVYHKNLEQKDTTN